MDKCPLTGLPCSQHKCIHVTDCNPNYTVKDSKSLCTSCGIDYSTHHEQVNPPPKEVTDVFDLINNLINAKKAQLGIGEIKKTVKTCPHCGFTLNDIASTNRIGCPDCYTFFKEELKPFIFNYHQASKHMGKSPKKKVNIEDLKKSLEDAIKKEDYEVAAKLRDEIKNLE